MVNDQQHTDRNQSKKDPNTALYVLKVKVNSAAMGVCSSMKAYRATPGHPATQKVSLGSSTSAVSMDCPFILGNDKGRVIWCDGE